MSTDARITKDLIQTLEDGKDGFAKGAQKLEDDDSAQIARTFRELSAQRSKFSDELQELAKDYGDHIEESGTVAAAIHRGWMTLKDVVTGSNPKGVLDVAEQGEDHAVKEYEKALEADISAGLRTVVARQLVEVRAAHNQVRDLRNAHA
ncbi:MAG: PA2169 family four-helix-bundle protein [Acidimicrobiales bacterium]|nr:PA2169 family four-helix-bundle protein [Acidimicrobiales bacterium]